MNISEQQIEEAIRVIESTAAQMIQASIIPETHTRNALERLKGIAIAVAYSDAGDGECRSALRAIRGAQMRLKDKLAERAA